MKSRIKLVKARDNIKYALATITGFKPEDKLSLSIALSVINWTLEAKDANYKSFEELLDAIQEKRDSESTGRIM